MSRYAEAHQVKGGPGDARPTALQIIQDENLINAMPDKVFLVTGCSSGIGIETGRALAVTGAKVFLTARNLDKARQVCPFLEPGRVELLELDTSSFASVRACAAAFLAKSPTLNVLVCNAGVMNVPQREETVDGFERQLATNYLGHFLLFWLLRDAMLSASTLEFNSRLVCVSSAAHHASGVKFEDFNLEATGAYDGAQAYGQSKTAMIYMANCVDRIYGQSGLHALSLMPGGIATNLTQYIPQAIKDSWDKVPLSKQWMKSPEQGAATTVLAAVAKEWEGKGGKYLEDCRVASMQPLIPGVKGYKEYIYDQDQEERTWTLTMENLGLMA